MKVIHAKFAIDSEIAIARNVGDRATMFELALFIAQGYHRLNLSRTSRRHVTG